MNSNFLLYTCTIKHKMNIAELPSEIQCHIRLYGYNPFVSNEDLYRMIRDINPRFSLMSLYDRLVSWKELVNDERGKALYEWLIKDKDVKSIGYNRITYADGTSTTNEYIEDNTHLISYNIDDDEPTYASNESMSRLINYIGNLRSDPLNPTYVFKRHVTPKVEHIYYKHTYVKNRHSVYDYSDELHDLIKELYPGFSLQKEYQKLSIRKKYNDMLDDNHRRFLTSIDKYLLNVEYKKKDQRLTLYIDTICDIDNIETNGIRFLPVELNELSESNKLIIGVDYESFLAIIAFISNDVYIKEYGIIMHGYKLPFQQDIIY